MQIVNFCVTLIAGNIVANYYISRIKPDGRFQGGKSVLILGKSTVVVAG